MKIKSIQKTILNLIRFMLNTQSKRENLGKKMKIVKKAPQKTNTFIVSINNST